MSDIDTAKIRAEFVQTRHSQVDVTIGALCDALDAARAERDQNWDLGNAMTIGLGVAAEQRDRSIARAEAAEARIAATLRYVGDPDEWPVPTMAPIMGKVYRLLTGGTE